MRKKFGEPLKQTTMMMKSLTQDVDGPHTHTRFSEMVIQMMSIVYLIYTLTHSVPASPSRARSSSACAPSRGTPS